jgi:hypothetical protein
MNHGSRRATAHHEAGHIILASERGLRLVEAEIEPTEQYCRGWTRTDPPEAPFWKDQLAILLAGKGAESLFNVFTHSTAWVTDRLRADKLVEHLDDHEAKAAFDEASDRASDLLSAKKELTAKVAKHLIERGRMTVDFEALMREHQTPA